LNSLGFSLLFLLGASLNDQLSRGELLLGVFIFVLYLPLELIHVLAHKEADKVKGIPTFALVYGERSAIALASVVLVVLMAYAGTLYLLGQASVYFALWSNLNFLLLLLFLGAAYGRNNSGEAYQRLRFETKLIGLIYGTGLLVLFISKT